MNLKFYRSLLLAICLVLGMLAGPGVIDTDQARLVGGAFGGLAFLAIVLFDRAVRRAPPYILFGGGIGMLGGVVAALLVRYLVGLGQYTPSLTIGVLILCMHIGFTLGARGIRSIRLQGVKTGMSASISPKILDTSAIIDGRIADMVELGFVGGPLVVPQFVLNEVQGIADSSDPLRRARGRRGLGVLEKLQSMDGVEVRIVDQDFPRVKEVDGKIVAMAKVKGATVVTTDFNLSKVAELQGVRVLNVHELSQALRPVVLPGEHIRVTIQKTGKEPGQGVGYLEDGTMVVVENGIDRMDESVETVVTSVLQTSAGRMIFSRMPGDADVVDVKEKRRVWGKRR